MQIRERTLYDVSAAMTELSSAMDFARSQKSAMALAKLIDTRCRLNGLLVERLKVESFVDIGSALMEARQRSNGVLQIPSTSVSVPETHRAHDPVEGDLFS